MINKLINEFRRNNEDKKLFIFYTLIALPILMLAQLSKKYIILNEFIAIIIIGIIMYIHICRKIKIKVFSKDILKIFTNISMYIQRKENGYKKFVIDYLKTNNSYTKSKIIFIIEDIRQRKEPKLKRDWLTFSLTVLLTILVAATSGGKIDFKIFESLVIQMLAIVVVGIVLYFLLLYGIRDIYKTTFSKESTLNLLDNILSDIYLEMKK